MDSALLRSSTPLVPPDISISPYSRRCIWCTPAVLTPSTGRTVKNLVRTAQSLAMSRYALLPLHFIPSPHPSCLLQLDVSFTSRIILASLLAWYLLTEGVDIPGTNLYRRTMSERLSRSKKSSCLSLHRFLVRPSRQRESSLVQGLCTG